MPGTDLHSPKGAIEEPQHQALVCLRSLSLSINTMVTQRFTVVKRVAQGPAVGGWTVRLSDLHCSMPPAPAHRPPSAVTSLLSESEVSLRPPFRQGPVALARLHSCEPLTHTRVEVLPWAAHPRDETPVLSTVSSLEGKSKNPGLPSPTWAC